MNMLLEGTKVVLHDGGKRLNVLGDHQRVLLSCAPVENCNPPGVDIPLHLRRNEDETFYVVAGKVRFQIRDEVIEAAAGTAVHLPRNTPHAFTIAGDGPAKMLMMFLPAGLEKYFEALSQLAPDEPPDMAKVVGISARYGIEFLSTPEA